jgi:hypothetical protein
MPLALSKVSTTRELAVHIGMPHVGPQQTDGTLAYEPLECTWYTTGSYMA